MASHILFDIEVRDRFAPALCEVLVGCNFLTDLCIKAEMNVLKTSVEKFPTHPDYKKTYPMGGGYTVLKLLSESHASIHTYPENRIASIDLFTCKGLDEKEIRKIVYELVYHFFGSSTQISYRHIRRRK